MVKWPTGLCEYNRVRETFVRDTERLAVGPEVCDTDRWQASVMLRPVGNKLQCEKPSLCCFEWNALYGFWIKGFSLLLPNMQNSTVSIYKVWTESFATNVHILCEKVQTGILCTVRAPTVSRDKWRVIGHVTGSDESPVCEQWQCTCVTCFVLTINKI